MRALSAILGVLAALSSPALAAGQTLCGEPVTRYLELVHAKTLRSNTAQNLHTFATGFVFTDGSHLSSVTNGLSFRTGPIAATRGQIARGPVSSPPVSFAALRRAANEARVGIQGSCRVVRPGGEESYLVKWYGRGGRTNAFTVSSEASGRPECAPEVVAFVDLLARYVADSPGERFVTP